LLLAAASFDAIVLWCMTPHVPFDVTAAPRAPDYDAPSAWSALPDRDDTADVYLPELPATNQTTAPVDVFYVHPTTYVADRWNAPIDDPSLNADTDRLATLIQASAFNACCAIYAPRYRQANGTAFTHPTPGGMLAVDLAYQDVVSAFRSYLAKHGHGRPFILA